MTFQSEPHNLSARAPFDFTQTLKFLGTFKPVIGSQTIAGQSLTKAWHLGEKVIVFRLQSSGTVEQPQLNCVLYAEQALSPDEQAAAIEDVRFYLSMDDDLQPFYEVGRSDPHFAPIVTYLYGYHQVKFSLTTFEAACWAVLSQRNTISTSRTMKARITEAYGGSLMVEDVLYRAFPQPEHIAHLDFDDLNSVTGNAWKTEVLLTVARAFDQINENWLRTAPYNEVESWLLNIKGIGAWSASFVLLRALGHVERMPVVEKHLLANARRVYGREELAPGDLARLADPYEAYKGYWAHYLRVAG